MNEELRQEIQSHQTKIKYLKDQYAKGCITYPEALKKALDLYNEFSERVTVIVMHYLCK